MLLRVVDSYGAPTLTGKQRDIGCTTMLYHTTTDATVVEVRFCVLLTSSGRQSRHVQQHSHITTSTVETDNSTRKGCCAAEPATTHTQQHGYITVCTVVTDNSMRKGCCAAEPAITPADRLPAEYLERVKATHEHGGYGSIG